MADGRNDQRVTIEALMDEQRLFPPSKEAYAQAIAISPSIYSERKDCYKILWPRGRDDDGVTSSRNRVSTLEVESSLATHQTISAVSTAAPNDRLARHVIAECMIPQGRIDSTLPPIHGLGRRVARIGTRSTSNTCQRVAGSLSGNITRTPKKDVSGKGELGGFTTLADERSLKEIAATAKDLTSPMEDGQ